MAFLVYLSVLVAYTKFLAFLMLSRCFTVIRSVIWRINGTHSQIQQNQKAENYSKSAQVMKIVFSYHLDFAVVPQINDFILLHDRFVSPEYVLRDDVTFLQITEKEAVFVQRKKGTPPPHSFPFFAIGQLASPEYIITMPMKSFITLADTMERDDAKIIFLQNISRCGGTLLTNVFGATGRCITFGEPTVLQGACCLHYSKGKWNHEVWKSVLRRVVLVLCKPYNSLPEKPLAYVIKPIATLSKAAELVAEVLPEATQFYVYRDPVKVAVSLHRAIEALNSCKILNYISNIPDASAKNMRFIRNFDIDFRGWTPKSDSGLLWSYRIASLTMMYYLQCRENDIEIHGLRYEQLIINPDRVLEIVFDLCGLPKSLIRKALAAMDRDSQVGSDLSRDTVLKAMRVLPKLTATFFEGAREIAKELGVPGPDIKWAEFMLPGTINVPI